MAVSQVVKPDLRQFRFLKYRPKVPIGQVRD